MPTVSSATGNQRSRPGDEPPGQDGLLRVDARRPASRIQSSGPTIDAVPFSEGLALRVSGELDIASAAALERELLRAATASKLVLLDLRETSFMDAAALDVITRSDRQMRASGSRLIVVPGSLAVRRLLSVTGMHSRLEIVEDGTPWPDGA